MIFFFLITCLYNVIMGLYCQYSEGIKVIIMLAGHLFLINEYSGVSREGEEKSK